MKAIAIFLLVLLATSEAAKTKSASGMTNFLGVSLNFSPKRSMMNLLVQIENKMKNGGPLDAITKMLADFKQTITEEQVAHDNLHEKQQEVCEDEVGFRHTEIADGTSALSAATETLDGCNAQYLRAQGDLAITKRQLGDQRNFLVFMKGGRERGQTAYEQDSSSTQEVIKLVEEALVIVEELFSGEEEFAQIVKHVNKIFRAAAHNRNQIVHIQPLLKVLVQMASQTNDLQLDEVLLNRIKTILSAFRENLNEVFQKVVSDEQGEVEAYANEKERLESNIESLTATQQELETETQSLNKCIVTQQGITSAARAKVDRNQKLLDDGDSLCGTAELEYTNASKARTGELKLLAALKERVEERFGELSEGVSERGKEDSFAYNNENDYEHKSFN